MRTARALMAVALAIVPAGSAYGQDRPVPSNDPAGWIGAEDYPADALRALSQGTVALTLAVDASGSVAGCVVTATSGSASLDAQACRLLAERARFRPSPAAVTRSYSTRIRWKLPIFDDRPPDPEPIAPIEIGQSTAIGDGGAELFVGGDGIITECRPIGRTYKNVPGPPDICRSYPVGARYGPPTTQHGRPMRRRVRIRLSIESTPLPGK